MRKLVCGIIVCLFCFPLFAQEQYDLVIVGGNPGGIMAAVAAAREGKTSVILERTSYVGGLPANGLGATDIHTRNATTGLFREFVQRIKKYYVEKYGPDSQQVKDCSDGYHFEPSAATKVFDDFLEENKSYIKVLTMRQFDADLQNVVKSGNSIQKIYLLNRLTGEREEYKGRVFLDATYEGDLGAAAGIPFKVGREGKTEFNEPGAGRVYKYWGGPEGSGSTFQADNAVQAYNYRLCLTNNPSNRLLFEKPEHYDREEYISMIEDVLLGRNTDKAMQSVTQEMMTQNKEKVLAGAKSSIPGDKWGIAKVTNMVGVPNQKTDANNQHGVFLSTDLPEENWPWPTSSWEWRDKFAQRLKEYIQGLFYFAQNDEALPKQFRDAVREWGLAKDEYLDNEHFPRQVYVREGRRFVGLHFFTANDAIPVKEGGRPPLYETSITASHYALDSHAVRKRESGRIHLDGFLSYPTAVYTVPYGVIVPKEVDNLLLPVPVSGSHIGFSTLRMEPCWMAMGQAAGVASSIAIDRKEKVQDVNILELQRKLIQQGMTLIYYKDVDPNDADFPLSQFMGLKGYLPEWNADLSKKIDEKTLNRWKELSGETLQDIVVGKSTRKDVLEQIYQSMLEKKDIVHKK